MLSIKIYINMRYFPYPEKEAITLAGLLYALSDSIRLEIVMTLSDGTEKGAYEFKSLCKSPTLAYHFRILREAGITKTRIEGRYHFISLRSEDLNTSFPGLIDTIVKSAKSSNKQ